MLQGAQSEIQCRAQGQQDDQLTCGNAGGIKPESAALNVNRQLEAHQKTVGQSRHQQRQQWQLAKANPAEIIHSHGRQNRGGRADEPVQRQGGGADQVEQQTAKAQSRNGGRCDKGQKAHSFGNSDLNNS